MADTADEFKNVALINKSKLKDKYFIIPVGGNEYKFKISGVGQKTIKIEKFFRYSEIIDAVQEGNDDGFEFLIEQVIVDPSKTKIPMLDSSFELKERASANKQALKKMFVEPVIGSKKYEFRLAGIGGKAIKIEAYVGYDDIAKVLNEGIKTSLEFILKEILVDNEIDYSIFENVDEYYLEDDEDEEDGFIDELESPNTDSFDFKKLSGAESSKIISKISGLQKLIFDAIDAIDDDIFTINDVLNQDLIKSYAVQGKSFEPIIIKNIDEFINLGIVAKSDDNYYKLW